MASYLHDPVEELELEEVLFDAVIHGSLENYEKQLRTMRDVDARGVGQRTLLHVAVKVGKADWVEMLLHLGADPDLRDRMNCSVLALAKSMVVKYPAELTRRSIMKMVKLVVESNAARGCRPMRSDRSSCGDAGIQENLTSDTHIQEMTDSRERLSRERLSQDVTSSSIASAITETFQSLSQNTIFHEESVNDIREEIGSLTQRLAVMKMAIHNVEYTLIKTTKIVGKLEVKVNLVAEECHPLEQRRNETNTKVREWLEEVERLKKLNLENPVDISPVYTEVFYFDCIEAMLKKTAILNVDAGKVSRVREIYEKLYSTSTMISCILEFLQFQPRVQIMIDFDYPTIARMKTNFRDPGGEERSGSYYATLADYEDQAVYQTAMLDLNFKEEHLMGSLAWSMAEMSTYLAFENGGRPYAKGDKFQEQRYQIIVKEAEKKKKELNEAGNFRWNYAFNRSSQLCTEVYLIASVPGFVAYYGEQKGISVFRKELLALLNFYKWNVMTTLMNKSKVST